MPSPRRVELTEPVDAAPRLGSALAPLRRDIPVDFELRGELVAGRDVLYDGGSGVAAYHGAWLVEPVVGEECLALAEIDSTMIAAERQNLDGTGHYSRPDVFSFTVHRRRLAATQFDGSMI